MSEDSGPLLLLKWAGGEIDGVPVPPFEVRAGEFRCLHLPGQYHGQAERLETSPLIQALTGQRLVAGMDVRGRACYADRPVNRRSLWSFYRSLYPVDWLQGQAGTSRKEAKDIVARLGLRPEWHLGQLAGNPRTLLALEAAWAQGADVVIFSAIGCDPTGWRAVGEAVAANLPRCAALHLSFPDIAGQWMCRFFPPGMCQEASRSVDRGMTSRPA